MSLASFIISCKQFFKEDNFREKIDKAKKEIAGQDFALSTYAFDSTKHWKIFSQITTKQTSGIQSTIIETEFKQKDNLVKKVTNDLKQKMSFEGQIFEDDVQEKISLYYQLIDEQNINTIFKISCKSNGEFSIEKLDSTKSKDWVRIKSLIKNKQQ